MSLFALPGLFAPRVEPPMWTFIIYNGLDWVATVPPTMALLSIMISQTRERSPVLIPARN